MSYNKMHNITKKDLVHTVNNEQKGYVLDYNYDNELHPNAPNKIAEAGKSEPRQYVYDGNGNPTSYSEEKSFRKMTWDEENRLTGINDNGRIYQYTYDASGERVIKSSGDSQNVAINGETAATIIHTDDYTAYVSPYFVVRKGKFTKHYFEGAGRIVSKLGNGTFAQPLGITAGGVNYTKLTAEQQKALDTYVKSLGVPPGPPTQQGIYATPEFTGNPYPSEALKAVEENQEPPKGWPRNPMFNAPGDVPGPPVQFGPPVEPTTVKPGEGFTGIGMPENDIFYFHSDHLGSTAYISNKNGSVSQHVEYIAFGEVLFEEHSSSFNTPYLFNGKELDRETNLTYYGARYLDMKTSLWLNVDPLAEKFPNTSPYAYCNNNPINLVDPDGEYPIVTITKQKAGSTLQRVIGYTQEGRRTRVSLYRVNVTDTEDKNYKMSFLVTRDAFAVRKKDASSGKLTNVAFEPKYGDVNHYTAKEISGGYPKGDGTKALKLTQFGSEVMHAEANDASVDLGYRTESDVASGVMLHVGGIYEHANGSTSCAASEGCFGVTDGSSSKSNPSNNYSDRVLGSIIEQANKSKTNKGKIEVIIEKRNSNERTNTKNN